MTAADIDALHAALDAAPADQGLRLVLADAVQEAGDEAGAEALRWLAALDRRPLAWSDPPWSWATWETANGALSRGPDRSAIPAPLYGGLEGGEEFLDHHGPWRAFGARRTAEEALMFAWGELDAAGRAACHAWTPPKARS